MAAARAKGVKIGRPKGSRDKLWMLDLYRGQIKEYLRLTLPLRRICVLINPLLSRPLTYAAYRCFVRQDAELLALWQGRRREQ
jgi:hypothetical protein